jgi:hypothetical protein
LISVGERGARPRQKWSAAAADFFVKFLADAESDLDLLRRLADEMAASGESETGVPRILLDKIAEQERLIARMRSYRSG